MESQRLVWILLALVALREGECQILPSKETRYTATGDYIIGGIFPLHLGVSGQQCLPTVSKWGTELSHTMIFAIDEINNNSAILPHCTLGFDIRDSCWSEEITLHSAFSMSAGLRSPTQAQSTMTPIGMIGPASSVNAVYAGKVANLYQIPLISYSATSNELSNKDRFPYFLRTVPPDKLQARAIVDILLYYKWTYVGLLYSADTYGIHGALEVLTLAEENGICVAFSLAIRSQPSPTEINNVVSRLHSFNKASTVVIFSYSSRIYTILQAFHAQYPDTRLICIGSDSFSGSALAYYGLADFTLGSFFVSLMQTKVPHFEDYFRSLTRSSPNDRPLSPWLTDWLMQKNCSDLESCPVEIDDYQSSVYSAVYAHAHALNDMHMSYNTTACLNTTGDTFLSYLLNVSFHSVGGWVRFDSDGNSGGKYRLRNLQVTPYGEYERVDVGFWDSEKAQNNLYISADQVQWSGGSSKPPLSVCREQCRPGFIPIPLEQKCCWGCQQCPANAIVVDGSVCRPCQPTFWPDANRTTCQTILPTSLDWMSTACLVIISISTVGLVSSLLTAAALFHYRAHSLIKATSRELSCINVVGVMIAFISVFVLLIPPSSVSCAFSEAAIALSLTLIYVPTLLKVNRIFRIFQAGRKSVRRPRLIGPKHQVILASFFIVVQVIMSGMSALFGPSLPSLLVLSDQRPYVQLYCSFGNGFFAITGYIIAIILACCFYAFRTRRVPSNYNESKFIGVNVYSTLVMFLAVVPVYATAIQVHQKVATLCVALQINAFLTLVLVYLPKLYAVRFVQDINVQEWRSVTTAPVGNQLSFVSGAESVFNRARVSPATANELCNS